MWVPLATASSHCIFKDFCTGCWQWGCMPTFTGVETKCEVWPNWANSGRDLKVYDIITRETTLLWVNSAGPCVHCRSPSRARARRQMSHISTYHNKVTTRWWVRNWEKHVISACDIINKPVHRWELACPSPPSSCSRPTTEILPRWITLQPFGPGIIKAGIHSLNREWNWGYLGIFFSWGLSLETGDIWLAYY